jgi:hypothetical protein
VVLKNKDPFVPLLIERKRGETQLFAKEVTVEGRRYIVCRNEGPRPSHVGARKVGSPACDRNPPHCHGAVRPDYARDDWRGTVPQDLLGSIVDRVEVDDREIRIVGRKDVMEQAVLANGRARCRRFAVFVRKWRAGQDETANTYVIEITL